jgi:lycopene beta-cyclase
MTAAANFDLIILGGGCAGLSLATELAHLGGTSPHAVVLESRQTYSHDRTWCYFKSDHSLARTDAQHTWQSMRVASSSGNIALDCGAARYEMVNAGQFYKNAQLTLGQSDQIDLKMGVVVTKPPEKQNDVWRIDTDLGTLYSRYVVDTRPAQLPHRDGATLWQSFYGEEIECDVGIFDVACGDLMDFAAADACGARQVLPEAVCFVYILPTTTKRALIEFTVFGPDPLPPESLHALHANAVALRFGSAAYSVLRSEHGVLPMGATPPVAVGDASYVLAGLTAGGARPSSGYAFARIQRWASSCAFSLATGNGPLGHAPDRLIQRVMDALFLKLVRARPDLAPELFVALFAGTDPQSVIRFLSDRATLGDYARVVASLLPGPLFRAMIKRNRQKYGDLPLLKV